MRLNSENQNEQIGTSFPGDNSKHIDFVIKYREKKIEENEENAGEEETRKNHRQAFFEQLKKEGFNIEYLKFERGNYVNVYALLNCSLDRLLIEAENLKLQMHLKSVNNIKLISK